MITPSEQQFEYFSFQRWYWLNTNLQLCQQRIMGNENCQDANQACKIAKQLLTPGKPPPKAIGKNTGEYWNDVHQYCRDANVAKDGLLVVKSKPDIQG